MRAHHMIFLWLVVLLASCERTQPEVAAPPPTINPVFLPASTMTSEIIETPTPTASPTPLPTPIPSPELPPPQIIFGDALNSDWDIIVIDDSQLNIAYSEHTRSGAQAIYFEPRLGAHTLLFTLRESAQRSYRADEVLAVTLHLYSGDSYIAVGDIAMAIIGSNNLSYYDATDDSVQLAANPNPGWKPIYDPISNRYGEIFSETWLSFLGVPNAVPPDTWVWVTNWIDERIFDPEYRYLTGFYIKGEVDFDNALVIDDVEIITVAP